MKVSIIIPVYNMEERLSSCLDSVINQTYKNIEIIIVNDGSKDNSLNIIRDYEKKDNRIKVINQRNMGISVARNNGINISTGDYLCFVDSDDSITHDMVEKLLDCILKNDADICVCDYYFVFDNGNTKVKKVGYKELFGGSLYEKPLLIKKIDYAPWNKIYKKELFKGIEFPKDTKYEDFEAILKVFSKAKKIVKLNKPLYNYYINQGGETRKETVKNMDMLKIAKNLTNYFDFDGDDHILKDSFYEVVSEKLLHSASTLFKITDNKTCQKYINDVYNYLNKNSNNWHKLYKNNEIDSNYIKFIRGHKITLKTYAFLRISMYKLLGR